MPRPQNVPLLLSSLVLALPPLHHLQETWAGSPVLPGVVSAPSDVVPDLHPPS